MLAVSDDDQKAEMEMDRAHPLQTNIMCHKDRPSAGILRVREREDNQGRPGIMTLRLTSERLATHGINKKGWPRTKISGRLLLMAYVLGGAMGLDWWLDR